MNATSTSGSLHRAPLPTAYVTAPRAVPAAGTLRRDIRRSAAISSVIYASLGGAFVHFAVIGVAAPLFALSAALCAGLLVGSLGSIARPERDAAVACLIAHYGISLDELSRRIENERAYAARSRSGIEVMPSWLYRRGWLGCQIARVDETAWVYMRGRDSKLIIHPLYAPRSKISIETDPGEAYELVRFIAARCSWTCTGWTEEIADAWHARAKREELVAKIIARRQLAARTW